MHVAGTVTTFRGLHAGTDVLLLPNAWDAASAALFAAAGARAVATTSAGLAWACGYPDGDALPSASLSFAIRSIRRAIGNLPLTADIENGFSGDPDDVANLVCELRGLGVAGVNLEDANAGPDLLAAKITAVKRRLAENGDDVFINARTDVYLRELASGEAAESETIARGRHYLRAGADGFFVPELSDAATIARIAGAVNLPLNLMAAPGLPPAKRLYELGVRRLSAGASIAKLAYGAGRAAAAAFVRDGDVGVLFAGPAVDYRDTNALLRKAEYGG
ncbi:MAG TPA: isocitrate lyase/phosphoenolpyruvate mutase family protein [Candidatus Tumulicola sp.]